MGNRSETVYIIGDRVLVVELAQLCLEAGFRVAGAINGQRDGIFLPKGMMRSAVAPRASSLAFDLSSDADFKRKNISLIERSIPAPTPILSSSVLITAGEQATWLRRPERLMGLSAFPTLMSQRLLEIAPTIKTDRESLNTVVAILQKLGKEISVVQDRIGMVMPRILCMLVNEAAFALTEQIALPQDIDVAMRLGTNYPSGPVEWGNRIGYKNVIAVLEALYRDLQEERYRTAPLLRQLAVL